MVSYTKCLKSYTPDNAIFENIKLGSVPIIILNYYLNTLIVPQVPNALDALINAYGCTVCESGSNNTDPTDCYFQHFLHRQPHRMYLDSKPQNVTINESQAY